MHGYCPSSFFDESLPCFIILKGEDQDYPADQPGATDELLALHVQVAVHEQDLPDHEEDGKPHEDQPARTAFRFALVETEEGNERKEDAHDCCHRIGFIPIYIRTSS